VTLSKLEIDSFDLGVLIITVIIDTGGLLSLGATRSAKVAFRVEGLFPQVCSFHPSFCLVYRLIIKNLKMSK
jgi:hypothetical protein